MIDTIIALCVGIFIGTNLGFIIAGLMSASERGVICFGEFMTESSKCFAGTIGKRSATNSWKKTGIIF